MRPVTSDDIGLKVLRKITLEVAQSPECVECVLPNSLFVICPFKHYIDTCSIVAIHGIGAHPDDSWYKNVGDKEIPRWVNWLEAEDMLPKIVPSARIMRYGYESKWFGEGAIKQKASTVAQRLLLALKRERKVRLYA
jgi:hypothetical protein